MAVLSPEDNVLQATMGWKEIRGKYRVVPGLLKYKVLNKSFDVHTGRM